MLIGQILWVLMAYFAGSIPFGLLIAKTFCNVDPRTGGSNSIGATNVSRLCGFHYGVLTLACDVAKGALPIWGALWLDPDPFFVSVTGMACVLGHVFSCFLGFTGGKAVATSIGVFLPLSFLAILGACSLGMLVIWRSNYVSLGSLTIFCSLPILLAFVEAWEWIPLSLILLIIIFVKHKDNIKRLLAGAEKPWLKSRNQGAK